MPDGAFIFIDECYTVFPKDGGTAKVPEFIERLAVSASQ
ncbi:zonular occludens toxin domain-containing protein [Dyella jiangningensis]